MAGGSDQPAEPEDVRKITQVPRDHFRPDSLDSAYQDVARFLQFKRGAQTMCQFLGRFDLRRKAGVRAQMGGSFPETSVWTTRIQNASLPRAEKSLVLAGAQGSLGIAAVAGQSGQFWPNGRHGTTACAGGDGCEGQDFLS